MTFFGEMFGYDKNGHDLMGEHREQQNNCPVCGISAFLHTDKMNAECASKLWGRREQPAEAKEGK